MISSHSVQLIIVFNDVQCCYLCYSLCLCPVSLLIQGDPQEPDIFKINSTQLFSSKFTFIYTKLKLKTCHTRWFSFKNDIGKMTIVFLDAVFKPFFFNSR